MQIQDFQINCNISVWRDGENFCAQIFWDDAETDEKLIKVPTELMLSMRINSAMTRRVNNELTHNTFPN